MKIMLFVWGQEMNTSVVWWLSFLSRLPQSFIITPYIRSGEKAEYKETLSRLEQDYKKIKISPIYLRASDSRFTNLLNPYILLSDFSSIFRGLVRSRPDVVVCFYLTQAFPLAAFRKILRFSLCTYAVGDDINLTPGLFHGLLRRFVYNQCDMIFAVANDLKRKIEKEHRGNVVVIPHGVDTVFYRPLGSRKVLRQKWGFASDDSVILTVCRLDKNKGVNILIKALQTLNSDKIKLLVVGEGVEKKALQELSSELDVRKNVVFLGFRGREELLELYNLADMFTLASYSEGLPRSLMEAMACGCIPLATTVGDIVEVVKDGFNGFLVSPGDHEKFVDKIKQRFSLSTEQVNAMKERARCTVIDGFDNVKLISRMMENINTLRVSQTDFSQREVPKSITR